MPLWSEISKLLYTSLNVAYQIAQRTFQSERSQFFIQLDEKICKTKEYKENVEDFFLLYIYFGYQ